MSNLLYPAFLNSMGSGGELLVVFLAILILFGTKSLPETLRTLGRWREQLRQISNDIQREILDAGEPLHKARKVWQEEMKDLTVSSGPRALPAEVPPPAPSPETTPPEERPSADA
jgi:Sec-independent protein translocase protein TatA